MAKIYNEIVIDMNPESSTFEETLYEDSFEYNGDMILLQEIGEKKSVSFSTDTYVDGELVPTTRYKNYMWNGYSWEQYSIGLEPSADLVEESTLRAQNSDEGQLEGDPYGVELNYVWENGQWKVYKWSSERNRFTQHETLPAGDKPPEGSMRYNSRAQFNEKTQAVTSGGETTYGASTGWGVENITKEDFLDPTTGKPLTTDQVLQNLIAKGMDDTGGKLRAQIDKLAPQYVGVDPTERAQAREGFEEDVYKLSKTAGEAATLASGAYGSGMGAQMRGAYGGMKDVSKKFKFAEEAYAKDVYGLEKGATQAYESEIEKWIGGMENPFGAEKGGYVFKDKSGISGNSNNNKTFLDILAELPDAGGN